MWDNEQHDFLTWEITQAKFNLTPMKVGDWAMIMDKIYGKWRHLLDEDSNTTSSGQWVGVYIDRGEYPTFVLNCVNEFAPSCMQLHHLSMSVPLQCFTVGTYSRCIREWESPVGYMVGFFHEVNIIHNTRGPQKKVIVRKSYLFTRK